MNRNALSRKLIRPLFLSALLIAGAGRVAVAMTIDFNGAVSPAAVAALQRAATQWTSRLSDPITVTINVSFANFAPSIIGQAASVELSTRNDGYDFARAALIADADADDGIVSHLPTAAAFAGAVHLPAGFSFNNELVATKANFKAMGITGLDPLFGPTDGAIQFNNVFNFDFDSGNGVSGTDFETVAAHEIGHILGFQSIVDEIDFALSQSLFGPVGVFPLDLFRFALGDASVDAAQFGVTGRELRPGVEAAFSDAVDVYRLSTGALSAGGDGRQASHFKDDGLLGLHLGIMDPSLANNIAFAVTDADLRVLDLVGWDVAFVPLPPALCLPALAMLAGVRRRI